MKDWASCRRRYYYAYVKGLQLKPEYQNVRMLAGSIMSEILDEIHKKTEDK